MRDSASRWLIAENDKISYVKYFRIFLCERNCRILIGLLKYVFINHPVMFLNGDNKTKLLLTLPHTLKKFVKRRL